MKYALLNNKRIEPQKGIKDAICPCCGELVIPKCGDIKIHHWAHKSKENCDPWWENETEWHRQWKDNFHKECQEIVMHDETTGEKHVADIKTQTGIVLEFQHSPISPEEQYSREQFYKNMIWIVDARKYYERFKKYLYLLEHCKNNKSYFYMHIDYYEEHINCFPKRWLESSVPVVLDYGIYDSTDDDYSKQKKWLWCIFPEKYTDDNKYNFSKKICGLYLKKENFINAVSNSKTFYPNIVISELEQLKVQYEKEKLEQEKKSQEEIRKQEEQYKQQQHELYKTKYPKEEKWRNAISYIKIKISENKSKLKKLYVSTNGEILDYDGHIYNNKKCIVLGIKSYPANYKGKEYTKNELLLLIQDDDKMITTTINIPSSILNGPSWLDYTLLYGSYNCYIRTLTVTPHYDKYSVWFKDEDRLWTTQKLKNDLEYIEKEFSIYKYNNV